MARHAAKCEVGGMEWAKACGFARGAHVVASPRVLLNGGGELENARDTWPWYTYRTAQTYTHRTFFTFCDYIYYTSYEISPFCILRVRSGRPSNKNSVVV